MALDDRAYRAALAGALPARLAWFAADRASGALIPTAGLLDEAQLARLLEDPARDRRAVVSVWALEAFEAVLPGVVAGTVLLGRVPAGETGWVLRDGRITGLRASAWVDGSFGEFAAAVLGPFVARAAARGGVSPRVLWSNAGHIVEAILGMLEREVGTTACTAALRDLLSRPLVGGVANALFAPVRYVEGRRVRRVCCLRFLVPSWRICLICPLPEGHTGRRRDVTIT